MFGDLGLWPEGIIPYEIDSGFPEAALQDLRRAIEEWNTKTVITLVKRTGETDFVRFRPGPFDSSIPPCSADPGRMGGEQFVNLESCGFQATIHEIGHAVGLYHEHQRMDRNAYVYVPDEFLGSRGALFTWLANGRGSGPYDYASPMNYRVPTFPPGIPVGSQGLSEGDVDGVARLYGHPPKLTTISTNPRGLEIIVDGKRVVSPARFEWMQGSSHVLEAPLLQGSGRQRYVFGRWSDERSRTRTVTADPSATWFEANYILQQHLTTCSDPPEAGMVTIRPDSRDGFHTFGTPIELGADSADAGRSSFTRWNQQGRVSGQFGSSPNPVRGGTPGIHEDGLEYAAEFSKGPVFLVDSNADGLRILVDGEPRSLPWAFPVGDYPNGFTVEAPISDPERVLDRTLVRHHFDNWSDGGSRIHEVVVPPAGGNLRLNVRTEFRLIAQAYAQGEDTDAVIVSPVSADGFFTAGTRVSVTAVPSQGMHFAGWVGDVSSLDPVESIKMDAPKYVEAVFARSQPVRPNESEAVVLADTSGFRLYRYEDGFNVLVPRGSSELTVTFQPSVASSDAEIDLYVRHGREVSEAEQYEAAVGSSEIRADFESANPGARETITINRDSRPPLASGIYFISLATQRSGAGVRGTLSAAIRRRGIDGVVPHALVFASPTAHDPGPQTIQVVQRTGGPIRYRIDSDRSWLSANPHEWVQTGAGTRDIAIAAYTAGLPVGIQRGRLTIARVDDSDADRRGMTAGHEIPVTLAVLPSGGGGVEAARARHVEIASRPQEGEEYGVGEEIEVVVLFSRPVEVTGSPALAITIGQSTREAGLAGVDQPAPCGGFESLTFPYVVQPGDLDSDGIGIAGDALKLNGGSIRDTSGAEAVLDLGSHAVVGDASHKVDGSRAAAPRVSSVLIISRPQDGQSYGAGEEIQVDVNFGTGVEVTGSPTLSLTVGDGPREAALKWAFAEGLRLGYVVRPGDLDRDGIGIGGDALELNGGSIRSAFGADAVLELGGHAIVGDAGHKVDGSRATAPEVSSVRITSRPQDGETYGAGEEIQVDVNFGTGVEVSGSPTLALTVGDGMRQAALKWAFAEGLRLGYVVQPGDLDRDGIGIGGDALELNGGSIRSAYGADAVLELGGHAIVGDAGHKVDGSRATAPEVSSVRITSRPRDGETYGAGEEITVDVRFGAGVEVSGSPTLALTVGDGMRQAALKSVFTEGLRLGYVVQPGDLDRDGIGIGGDALELNGGSIRSAYGADAVLELGGHAIVGDAGHKVDGSRAAAPEVRSVRITSRPRDGETYGAGEEITVDVRFGAGVEVSGSPTLALTVGDGMRQAALKWAFAEGLRLGYVVQPGDLDRDGIGIGGDALELNGGSIQSAYGADAVLELGSHAIIGAAGHKVDGSRAAAPAVSSVRITSRPRDGESYGAGEEILVDVSFDTRIEVTGSPTLALAVDDGLREAALKSVFTDGLRLGYMVRPGDRDRDGIGIGGDALELNGGSIRSAYGADAVLELGSHAIIGAAGHKVDGSRAAAPEVSSVRITSRPQDGETYGAGEEITVDVRFGAGVEVTGSPTLALTIGDGPRRAALKSAFADGLRLGYVVQPGDRDRDGIGIGGDALELNGGSIRSAFGADAVLELGIHAIVGAAGHNVDGSRATAPEVSSVRITSRPQDGESYGAGEEITVDVRFGIGVEVTGSPTLALTVGDGTRQAALKLAYADGLRLGYGVRPGDLDRDGIGIGGDALELNGGSIRSAFGADAVLELGSHAIVGAAGHGVDGSRAAAPRVSSVRITSRPRDGESYGAGEEILVDVSFDTRIEVTGSPTLALAVDDGLREAALKSVFTDGLRLGYMVRPGDRDRDGIGIGGDALELNGGSIRSAYGADAVLELGSHAIIGAAGHKVDGSRAAAPEVSSVRITSRPQDGETYGAGEEITVDVRFGAGVEVTGSPTLALTIGDGPRRAALKSAFADGLRLGYVVQPGDRDRDGIGIGGDALELNGGSIRSAFGADAVLELGIHAIVGAAGHNVDGSRATAPEVSSVRITSRPQDGESYGAGEEITVDVRFGIGVEVTGSPTLALTVGDGTRQAALKLAYADGLRLGYGVRPGDLDRDGIGIGGDALELNGGSIRSAFGADAVLELGSHAIVGAAGHGVDGSRAAAPRVSSVRIISRPQDGETYGAGEEIAVDVRFGTGIEVTGSPTLALTVGDGTRRAELKWAFGDGLRVGYVVRPGDLDRDGIGIAGDALELNGGSVRSASGTDAVLELGSHAIVGAASHKVDGSQATAPRVRLVRIISRPQDGVSYGAGERIAIDVFFDTGIEVTGSPTLALTVGDGTRQAALKSVFDDALRLGYVVQPGDRDSDGIGIAGDALELNGGSIRSAFGTDAILDLGSHAIASDGSHKVDGGG